MMTEAPDGILIDGRWQPGSGEPLRSFSPSDDSLVWQGTAADSEQVRQATAAARRAFPGWWRLSEDQRIERVGHFAQRVENARDDLARLISHETGKPLWESRSEVGAVIGKAPLSVEALQQRRSENSFPAGDATAVTRYKPFGVLGVLGPFNFPAHLANGHIIPALLAGNTLVFKPSELAPAVGAWMARKWQEAGLPSGVLNLVQGGRETGETLSLDPELDGLLFTGSSAGGRALHEAWSRWPHKMLALEMGGNNPLVVHRPGDLQAAALETILSAFLTAGQRCTCARRLIITAESQPDRLLDTLAELLTGVRSGLWTDEPEPFHGPVITARQASRLLGQQDELIGRGGKPVVPMTRDERCAALLRPGVIDVTGVPDVPDEEMFGPILQVIRVESLDDAIREANNTRYGLAAGFFGERREDYEKFLHHIRAGVVNWNRQTTGASGKLAFGGAGLSGNNRPGGYFAIDYCNWPVASMEVSRLQWPTNPPVGLDLGRFP